MVCLQGITENRLRQSLTKQQLSHFPLFNWLIHKLTKYIYSTYDGKCKFPICPEKGDKINKYTEWFDNVGRVLGKTFIDVTQERIFSCCNNPPCEEVALIIYNATSLEIQKGFYYSIPEDNFNNYLEEKEEKNIIINPADDNKWGTGGSVIDLTLSDDDSMPDLENYDNNSLPDLIPVN